MTSDEVRELRKTITNAAFRGERIDKSGKFPLPAPLARNVLTAAEQQGLSGEDTMTWLAYEALCGHERMTDQVIEYAMLQPSSSVFSSPTRKP